MALGSDALRRFGEDADQGRPQRVGFEGTIEPGDGALDQEPGTMKEMDPHEQRRQGEGSQRPAARPREGPRAPSAPAAGASAHPILPVVAERLQLGEVMRYHPCGWWSSISPSVAHLNLPVRLFPELSYRPILTLELPRAENAWLFMRPLRDGEEYERSPLRPAARLSPPIRTWAHWQEGIRVRSHHENPDGTICAAMGTDWAYGDPLIDLVNFCICWIAKSLHMSTIGNWPGPQHYPPHLRVARMATGEFCGCGSAKRYSRCCLSSDLRWTPAELALMRERTAALYYFELSRRALRLDPIGGRLRPTLSLAHVPPRVHISREETKARKAS